MAIRRSSATHPSHHPEFPADSCSSGGLRKDDSPRIGSVVVINNLFYSALDQCPRKGHTKQYAGATVTDILRMLRDANPPCSEVACQSIGCNRAGSRHILLGPTILLFGVASHLWSSWFLVNFIRVTRTQHHDCGFESLAPSHRISVCLRIDPYEGAERLSAASHVSTSCASGVRPGRATEMQVGVCYA